MLFNIPIQNNYFNFSALFVAANVEYYIEFLWQGRDKSFLINLGRGIDDYFKTGIPAITNTILNQNVESQLPGMLFLNSSDPRIEKPDFTQLGFETQLFYDDLIS